MSEQLPERGVTYTESDCPFVDSATMYVPDGRIETNRTNYSSVSGGCIAYTDTDIGDVRAACATTDLSVPTYYSRFDDAETRVTSLDTGGGNHAAWAITPRRLEDAVRVAVGGGRYRSDDLSVVVLDDHDVFLVAYDGDVWAASAESIKSLPDDYEYDETTVCGLTAPDDSPSVLRGMERALPLLRDQYDETIVAYDHLDRNYHYFRRDDGSTVGVRGSYFHKLGTAVADASEVQTTYTIDTEYDETFTVSWDDIDYEIGEDPRSHGGKGCVAAYQLRWEDPRTSSRVRMDGKITCRATYFYLLYRDKYDRYEVRDTQETIAKFDPTTARDELTPF